MIKTAKLSEYYFYMNVNIWGGFQIYVSVPLRVASQTNDSGRKPWEIFEKKFSFSKATGCRPAALLKMNTFTYIFQKCLPEL